MTLPSKKMHQIAITKPTTSAEMSSSDIENRKLRLSYSKLAPFNTISSRRKLIALHKLEEEKTLREERDHHYLKQKYRIINERYGSDRTTEKSHTNCTSITKKWIIDQYDYYQTIQDTIRKSIKEDSRTPDKTVILNRLQSKVEYKANGFEKCDICFMVCDKDYFDKCCTCNKTFHQNCMDTIIIRARNYFMCPECQDSRLKIQEKGRNCDQPVKTENLSTTKNQPKNLNSMVQDVPDNQTHRCDECGRINSELPIVACDVCDNWYHHHCIKLTIIDGKVLWICTKCTDPVAITQIIELQPSNPSKRITKIFPSKKPSKRTPDQPNDIQGQQVSEPLPGVTNVLTSTQIASRYVVTKDLPIFDGQPEQWPMFLSRFNNSTDLCGYSNSENLDRLQKCLKGHALDAVSSRLLNAESVPDILKTLNMLYGRPELIINSLMKKIRDEPPPKAENLNTLVDFALSVRNVCAILEQAQLNQHLSNPALIHELIEKLPTYIKIEWAKYKVGNRNVTLSTLGNFLYNLAEVVVSVTTPEEIYDSDDDNGSSNQLIQPIYGVREDEWLFPNRIKSKKEYLLTHFEDKSISGSNPHLAPFDVHPEICLTIEPVDSKTGGTVVNVDDNTDPSETSLPTGSEVPTEDRSSEEEFEMSYLTSDQ